MDQKKIGLFLKELRKEKELTQEQLSEKLGVTNRSISRWENGANMPDLDLVIEIVNYFDISIEEFLDGERRTDMIDKKTEETVLKVADYSSEEKMIFSKRLNIFYIMAIIAFIIYAVLDIQGLTENGIYENIADVTWGVVLGALISGMICTSKYRSKISAFRHRLQNRIK